MAGMNTELLEVVTSRSMAFLRDLAAAGSDNCVVHINVTPSDLRQLGTADLLLGTLFDYGIEPQRLVVEVTESDILEFDERVRATLLQLDASGAHLAVDDFGTGFSSLSHLLDLPTDHLKIDRRFVADLTTDADARMLVAGIIGLAGGLNLQTVAEGVETEEHASELTALGCTQLQGYLIAPALPPAQAVAFALAKSANGRIVSPSA
jgi:EAL domain-containing protein (putative c-di-GMP-specific phosphodiesterase class I)